MRRPEPRTQRLIAALLLGAVSVAAFAPLGAFPLLWITLGALFTLLNRSVQAPLGGATGAQRWRAGGVIGAAFGFGLFGAGVSWIYVSLSTFGGMPAPVAALATVCFCALMSLYPALACAVYLRFIPPNFVQRGFLFAALWTLGEWLRGWVFTGFPWLSVGYSQAPGSPLAGFTPLLGVFGTGFLTVLLSAALGEAFHRALDRSPGEYRRAIRHLALPLASAGILLLTGSLLLAARWTSPQGEALSVALLQGNVPQDLKWRPEKFDESLQTYYQLARDNPAQLTILPETALPAFLEQIPPVYLDALSRLAEREDGDMLLGVPLSDEGQYANGAISLGRSPSQRYRKSHLVPFGEFVPPGFSWFLAMANIPMSDFRPGPAHQPALRLAGQSVAVNICYEDAFGEAIIGSLPAASLLVNISNVAWFGDSLAPAQHLQIAQTRALETGRPMLRATNTGMTAIVGSDGRLQGILQPFTRAALRGQVRGYTGSTPYSRWGNWPTIGACALMVVLIATVTAATQRKRDTVS